MSRTYTRDERRALLLRARELTLAGEHVLASRLFKLIGASIR